MTILMVNGGGNTPNGLESKGGTAPPTETFYVLPSLPSDPVDGSDFLVWHRQLGTAVSEASNQWGLSHGPERIEATVDLLGSAPQTFEY
jgi:hypothetical protein